MAGAPLGNTNAAKKGRWADALNKALARYKSETVNTGEALDKIAMNVVEAAIDGDPVAVVEIANRLDGKAAQSINVGGQDENPVKVAHKVEFIGSRDK